MPTAPMKTNAHRKADYYTQNGCERLTPAQRRRVKAKAYREAKK